MDYKYKGYKIGSRSLEWDKYKKGFCWNVHKIGSDSNVCFETIRKAKEWINKQILRENDMCTLAQKKELFVKKNGAGVEVKVPVPPVTIRDDYPSPFSSVPSDILQS